MIMNRCAYLDRDHRFTLVKKQVEEPESDQVLVKIAANGICGSDIHFYSEGRLGNFVVTEPYIPGHEASGTVTAVGSRVKGILPGERVVIEPGIPCGRCTYCKSGRYNLCPEVVFLSAPPMNGTFCDYISVRWDCVHKMPETMSFEQGALVEPVAVAVHAANRAGALNGKTAAVVGAGPIGLLTLLALKASGCGHTVCIDRVAARLEMAKKLGADEVVDISQDQKRLSEIADVVVETAGSAQATATLFDLARMGGRVVQVGWPAGNKVEMDIACFLDKELDYSGVNRYANAFPTAIDWIGSGRIRVEEIVTQRYAFDDTAEAFRFAKDHPEQVIKVIVVNE